MGLQRDGEKIGTVSQSCRRAFPQEIRSEVRTFCTPENVLRRTSGLR